MAATDEGVEAKLAELERLRHEALHPADERAVARQRERGKLLARERISSSTPARSSSSTASSATATRTSG